MTDAERLEHLDQVMRILLRAPHFAGGRGVGDVARIHLRGRSGWPPFLELRGVYHLLITDEQAEALTSTWLLPADT